MPTQKAFYLTLILAFLSLSCKNKNSDQFDKSLRFESSQGKETATYEEMISFYTEASNFSAKVEMKTMGTTDCGLPLHLITVKNEKALDADLHVLINNGIHPGESDGIDASMMLLRDIINDKMVLPDGLVLHIIPAYNLGGMLNRNSTSRANQNGPEAYGFRGNARNYDLNRDFMKMDTDNAKAFAEIYHNINPDVYVETHVSNGADYQYTLTHLMTQHNKMGHDMGQFIYNTFTPEMEKDIRSKDLLITPYVNVYGSTPEQGFSQFFDSPRYSTGYTSLWHTLGLMIETHMLKPYNKRVFATKAMLESLLVVSARYKEDIKSIRNKNFEAYEVEDYYKFNFKVDSTQYSILDFKGYEAVYTESEVTGQSRLKYLKNRPKTFAVNYFDHFKASDAVRIPDYYVMGRAWDDVLQRLQLNQVKMTTIKNDTLINAEVYKIKNYSTYTSAYEGHYPHYDTKVEVLQETLNLNVGDVLISTHQPARRYIIEALEPELKDSFFNWNFFDSILQQKEGFSAYVFEDYAPNFLDDHPEIRKEFQLKKANDSSFKASTYKQLDWIFKQSPLYEKSHLRYPVFRVFN